VDYIREMMEFDALPDPVRALINEYGFTPVVDAALMLGNGKGLAGVKDYDEFRRFLEADRRKREEITFEAVLGVKRDT
jgi:hypothetical protein